MKEFFEKLNAEQEKIAQEIIKNETALLEVFLMEYCKVQGLEEKDLRSNVQIVHYHSNHTVAIVSVENVEDVKLGIQYHSEMIKGECRQWIELYGAFISEKSKYPKTVEFWNSINPKYREI